MSTFNSRAIVYKEFGDPRKVLEIVNISLNTTPDKGQVLVKWLASPVNPLDINRIQGNYMVKEELPTIGGSEGIGKVIKVGPGSSYAPGDLVTIFTWGTPFWAEYGIIDEADLFKFHPKMDIDTGATFMVNPPTAWVMLTQFVKLNKGDYVIQNSANSGVGRNVIQLCKAWGYKSINIVRDRKEIGALKTELWKLGADHIFTEEEFKDTGRKFIKSLRTPPRLAMNGVGGRSVLTISSVLERSGTCVVYGGMSKKAHEFSTSAMVFNDLRVRGVAIGWWMRQPENQAIFQQCMKELQELAIAGHLSGPPMDHVFLDDYRLAIEKSISGGHRKQLIILHRPDSKL